MSNKIMHKSNDVNSFFIKINKNDVMSTKEIFCEKPEYKNREIKVLQIMVLDEDHLIVECSHVKTPKL
jgi:hypothetical protein